MATASNKIRTNVYLDADIKKKAQEIFKQYGMGLSDAFNIFLAQSVPDFAQKHYKKLRSFPIYGKRRVGSIL